MRKTPSFFRAVPGLCCLAAGILLICLLGIVVAGQHAFECYYTGSLSLLSNAVLWTVSLVVSGLLLWANTRLGEKAPGRTELWAIRGLFLAVLGVQFLIARSCWFHMGWDAQKVHMTAEELARGVSLTDPDYFRSCSNNAPLALLQAVPLWAAVKIGLSVPYVVLPYIDAVLLNLSAYLCVLCVRELTQSRMARLFALVVSIGWIALSPYILYPYSDSFVILFPVMCLYLWIKCSKPVLKWLLISFFGFAGACIKPTVLIVIIALIALEICRGLSAPRQIRWKRALAICAVIVLGAMPGLWFKGFSIEYITGIRSPEEQMTATHYLMLGMNDKTYGGHSMDDVNYTHTFATLAEKQQAQLQMTWKRLSDRGILGNLRFFTIKAYKAYADGSFAAHSSFLTLDVPERTDGLSTLLRSFYFKSGAYAQYCHTLVQSLWLGVLTLCAAAVIRCRRHPAAAVLGLTILGLTAYLLLFEVWPRYLFLYAPFFVILAAMVFHRMPKNN